MGLKKVYWITLVRLVKILCEYWINHKVQMPSDLPNSAVLWLNQVEPACQALLAYDRARPRGGTV